MKKIILLFFILAVVTIYFSGCYVEPASTTDENLTLNIDMHSQAPVGYAGTGIYIKSSVYDADTASYMLDEGIITFYQDGEWGEYAYIPENLLPALNTQSFYVAPNNEDPSAYAGIIAIIDLPPTRRYRIFLEWVNYWEGDGADPPQYAGMTETFNVSAGMLATTSVTLYQTFLS